MTKWRVLAAVLSVAVIAGGLGCGKSDQNKSQTTPTTNASGGDQPLASPNVGIKPVPESEYKPAVGKYGGRLVRDSLGEPKSFNPVTAGETSTTEYTGRMFQGLTDQNAFTGDVKPLLAEKWEVAPDGLTWTFHLRKDVKFNDGTPLTSADVVFTWNELVYELSRPKGKEARWPCSLRDIATF